MTPPEQTDPFFIFLISSDVFTFLQSRTHHHQNSISACNVGCFRLPGITHTKRKGIGQRHILTGVLCTGDYNIFADIRKRENRQ